MYLADFHRKYARQLLDLDTQGFEHSYRALQKDLGGVEQWPDRHRGHRRTVSSFMVSALLIPTLAGATRAASAEAVTTYGALALWARAEDGIPMPVACPRTEQGTFFDALDEIIGNPALAATVARIDLAWRRRIAVIHFTDGTYTPFTEAGPESSDERARSLGRELVRSCPGPLLAAVARDLAA